MVAMVNTDFKNNPIPLLAMGGNSAQAKQTAEKLAGVFFSQVVNECLKEDEPLGGFGEQMVRSFFNEILGEKLAESGAARDLTGAIERQILHLQETSSPLNLMEKRYES
ncbi:hypothetical protein [Candidatus Nucleicultrix amoebiphila]|jgi:hypothetical protein|uniref:Flagellar protein FlgJ N-terminal domain-containing protein n=1 Tax=Candidatus Nucleicultrix amoebiphila FS5 TaxID=1414854 RepID=A0A1W6N3T9_9PROT|nr:hypothetical protein [Candidatus Nucleicultrix amoebiphila]ARN84525.1 hypothetical protein GQ61_03400 [Candidatus Nucleicultrix amoebiphila FS5]